MVKNIVIVGSSSEISKAFYKVAIEKKLNIYKISSIETGNNVLKVENYAHDIGKIINFIEILDNPIVIFFNGYLKENRIKQFPDIDEIYETVNINFLVPYTIALKLQENKKYEKLIFISSISALKPRFKNYIYGLSKMNLEHALKYLDFKKTLIIRFGLVKTNMSIGHIVPPFANLPIEAAQIIFKNINKNGIIYSSFGERTLAFCIKYLPIRFINYLESQKFGK